MKYSLSLFIFIFSSISVFSQNTYYVSTDGNDTNTGLTISESWKTLSYAASTDSSVEAGDTVYIKAGNYEAENVVFEKSGTLANPIIFEGYQSTPGDNPSIDYVYGNSVDPTKMPLLDGGDRNNGVGIEIVGYYYIQIKNIQITNYEAGIYSWNATFTETGLTVENVFIKNIGFEYASALQLSSSSNNTVKDCVIVNATGAGMDVSGNYNLIDNCQVYSDENYATVGDHFASSDYYIVIAGDYNTIKDCYIERVGYLEDVGHGIGVKENAQYNIFENCTAKNLEGGGFYVRWEGAQHNEFNHCKSIATIDYVTGFLVRAGASFNSFNSCISEGCDSGIRFSVSGEDADFCGRNNTFNNCIIRNSIWAIEYSTWSIPGLADETLFANCVFDTADFLFYTGRENDDNKMINCVIKDIPNLVEGTEPLNFQYTYSNFFNSFSTPTGEGNISDDPLFVDALNANYHLQTTSPCIDSGTAIEAPSTDFEGVARPQGAGFDMGAYEYVDSSFIDEEGVDNYMLVYPNPTHSKITIKCEDIQKGRIVISNILGKQLISKPYLKNETINITDLEAGLYFVQLINSAHTKSYQVKIIKR